MREFKLKLVADISILLSEYGQFESEFYHDMLSFDRYHDYIHGYAMTHCDDVHLQSIQDLLKDKKRVRTRRLSSSHCTTTLSISKADMATVNWLSYGAT